MQAKPFFIWQPGEGAPARHRFGRDATFVRYGCLTRICAMIKPRAQRISEGGEASVKYDCGTGREGDPFDRATDFHISLSGSVPKSDS